MPAGDPGGNSSSASPGAGIGPARGQGGDRGGQPDPHPSLHLGWRPRRLVEPGYDCSGAVSFALHGAGLITTSMDSGEMMNWGVPGKGRWITIYANAGHAFAVIDGLRGTPSATPRHRPSLASGMVSTKGFVARHPAGY